MSRDTLKNEFLMESFKNLSAINENLTLYEKEPENQELLNQIYRAVHTMKGSAGFLGYNKLQELTHSAENLLDALRDQTLVINPNMMELLLQTFAMCSNILKSIESSDDEGKVMSARMQPIGSIFTKLERPISDLSRENDKKISLKLSGQDIELDKILIEAIKDPLVHIIRNAADHGLEKVSEREAVGKSATGTIHIKAYNESGQVTVEISDDGKGLDRNRIGLKAIEKGLIAAEQFKSMSDQEVFALIFIPGFSTAEKITNISGRGVGMDIVKTNIEKIGGSVIVDSEIGKGTVIKLKFHNQV